MQRGDLTAFAEAVYLYRKQHPRQFPHELKHDPEKCAAVFGKDHAQTRS
jgi:hypothetical protein